MRFGASQWLWGLAALPLLLGFLVWIWRARARLAARFADGVLWKQLAGEEPVAARRWKPILFILAVALMIVGLAGPQWGARAVMLQRRGLDIVIALDVSRSMLAADVKPNRLERAKREISGILDRLAGDRIGLVVFSGDAFVQCPLTLDASAARMLLDAVGVNSGGRPGTIIAEAIETAIGMYEQNERQFKILILVTDGEGHEGDPLAAAQKAAEAGIRIYTVGIGTPQGEPIPEFDERGNQIGFKKDENGQVVLSKLDEVTLQKVALATNGHCFRAGPAQMELDALFDELSTLEKKEMEGRLFTEFEQRFHYFLIPAFLLLAVEMALPARPRRTGAPQR
jgi:Ca-activated chloride channel family protein